MWRFSSEPPIGRENSPLGASVYVSAKLSHNVRPECYDPSVKEWKVFFTVFLTIVKVHPSRCHECTILLDRSSPAVPPSFRTY